MERTLEVDLRRKREEEERARKRKSVGDSRREEKKERKRRKMAHTHTHTHFDHEDAKKDTHVPISSAVDKQFTEPGGHKVKLLIPLNSCTPSLGAGALLPTSKMTPRTTGNAVEFRTNDRRRDNAFWGRLFWFSSFDDDARMAEHARLDGLLETDAERMMRVGLMNGICVSILLC